MKLFAILKLSQWKLTPKLLAAFLLVAVVPVLAASLFTLNYFYTVSYDSARQNLHRELGVALHFFEEARQTLASDTRQVARENVVALNLSLGLTAPVLDYLEGIRTERHLAIAELLDAEGRPVRLAAAGAPARDPVFSVDRLGQARAQNGVSFSTAWQDGRTLVVALVPVTDDAESAPYFLAAGFDPASREVGGFLDRVRQAVSGPVVLGTAQTLLGSSADAPDWAGARWPGTQTASGELVPESAQGATYLFGFAALEQPRHSPWIGVSFSLDGFRKVTGAAAGGLVLITLVCLTLSSLAAIGLSRGLTRPLLMMARQASAWTEGQGGKRLTIATDDETGTLGRAFNGVLDRLDGTLEALRKTQNYLKNIFNSLTSVLVSVDETGTVQEWNVAAERFAGLKAAEALGKKIWDLSPVFVGLDPLLDLAVATREPQYAKKDMGRGHEKRTFDLCVYPLVWNGISGAVVRMDDITESLKKDRQLLQAQKMETIGTLSEGIAHNFNNLLTGITGTVSLVNLELAEESTTPAQLRSRMAMIEESTQRASEIVRRLMALTRGGGGEFVSVDLASVVRDVVKTCRMVLDNSVEVEASVVPGPAWTSGDRSQLDQALLNLIINASHAMTIMRPEGEHRGGLVKVTLRSVSAIKDFLASHPEAVHSDYWILQVQDGGVGIAPGDLPKIFDPFFTTKDQDKGSGLGLATVFATVRQHGGLIDVYSEVGRGTTFSLYFPVLVQMISAQPTPLVPAAADPYLGSGLILVVDDEPIVVATAKSILEACGYAVVTAENGVEALAVYLSQGKEIRAVVLDSSMPRLSGAETLVSLKELNPQVKVLMTSGLFEGRRPPKPSAGGNIRFLAKPFSLVELSRALFDLLEGKE